MAEIQIEPTHGVSQPGIAAKACSRCSGVFPATVEHFSFIKARGHFHSWCKPCCAADRRRDRAESPARYKALEADRYRKHGEVRRAKCREYWSAYAAANAETLKERAAERRDKYNENRRAAHAASEDRRKATVEANRKWRAENAEKLAESRRAKWAAATPTQRLRSYIGSSISHALKKGSKGGKSWQDLVGYRAADLKSHLERQFIKGMTWANYGEWHVDHIAPASSFKYETPQDPDFLACWALTNLRPLWAAENIRKRNHRTLLI